MPVVDDVVAVDPRVQDRDLGQGQQAGAAEERHEPEVDAVALAEPRAEALARGEKAREVDLVERGENGGGALGLDQPFGDPSGGAGSSASARSHRSPR